VSVTLTLPTPTTPMPWRGRHTRGAEAEAKLSPMRSDRRTAIVDAAIELLAEGGTRALTHRMVDRRLGIADGSTSTYHRTRAGLVRAAAVRVAELELATVASTSSAMPADVDTAEIIAALVSHAMDPERRDQTLARYVLFTEAANDKELAVIMLQGRAPLLTAGEQLLRRAGAKHPERSARALAAFINGLVLGQFVTPEPLLAGNEMLLSIREFLESC
jgi:TetR/AcrR family transcriptional regulator, regulator of biofilm formation and stress response